MKFGVALQPEDGIDRNRLLWSVGGAVLVASLGFMLIFVVFAWLPYLVMTPSGNLSPAAEALLARFPAPTRGMSAAIGPMMIMMAGVLPAIIGVVRGRGRGKQGR